MIEKFRLSNSPVPHAKALPLILHDPTPAAILEEIRETFPYGQVVATSNNLEASATMVVQGMGVCRLPQFLGISLPNVQAVIPSTAGPTRSLWILTHKDMKSIKRIVAFVDFIYDRLISNQSVFK